MATAQQIANWLATDKNAPRRLDAVLAQQTPQVRDTVKAAIRHLELAEDGGGRLMPFEDRQTTKDVCSFHGLDEKAAKRVYQSLVDNSICSGLQAQMGTDAQLPVPEPTLRDHVEAALNIHHLDSNQE